MNDIWLVGLNLAAWTALFLYLLRLEARIGRREDDT